MRAHIDVPAAGSKIAPRTFTVQGWLWLDDAQPEIAAVEAWCANTVVGKTTELHARPDVVSALGLPSGVLTGFSILAGPAATDDGLDLTLEIRARLRNGTRTPPLAIHSITLRTTKTEPLPLLKAQLQPGAQGLEIGAHALPVPGLSPFYTDSVAAYAGTAGRADFLADARALPLPDDTLDYLCSSHVLEHLPNPLAALREWHRVLRAGGWLYLIVPDKRHTFDAPRPLTPPEHLWRDFLNDATAAESAAHVDEFIYQTDWGRLRPDCPVVERATQQAAAHARYLDDIRRGMAIDIHFHTFTLESLLTALRGAGLVGGSAAHFDLTAQAERYPRERGDGIALLLRKRRASTDAAAPATYAHAHTNPAIAPLPLVCPISLEPLRAEADPAGQPTLVAMRSGRRYPFHGQRPALLPLNPIRPIRPWNSRSRRWLSLTTARARMAFSR